MSAPNEQGVAIGHRTQHVCDQIKTMEMIANADPCMAEKIAEALSKIEATTQEAMKKLIGEDGNAMRTIMNLALYRSGQHHSTQERGPGRPRTKRSSTELGECIRKFRKERGWSQNELMKQMDFTKAQYISKLEGGLIIQPSKEFLQKFAEISGHALDTLQIMCRNFIEQR